MHVLAAAGQRNWASAPRQVPESRLLGGELSQRVGQRLTLAIAEATGATGRGDPGLLKHRCGFGRAVAAQAFEQGDDFGSADNGVGLGPVQHRGDGLFPAGDCLE